MMKSTLGHFSVPIHKQIPFNENGAEGYRTVKIGTREGVVSLLIDERKLERHARKALANSSGKSVLAGGGIRFVVDRESVREIED